MRRVRRVRRSTIGLCFVFAAALLIYILIRPGAEQSRGTTPTPPASASSVSAATGSSGLAVLRES